MLHRYSIGAVATRVKERMFHVKHPHVSLSEEVRGNARKYEETRGSTRKYEETRGNARKREETRGNARKIRFLGQMMYFFFTGVPKAHSVSEIPQCVRNTTLDNEQYNGARSPKGLATTRRRRWLLRDGARGRRRCFFFAAG
jgi:hypothetical protein